MNLSVILDVFWMIVGILLFGSWILGIYYQSKTRSPVVMAKLRQEGWWQVLRPTPLPPKRLLGPEELYYYEKTLLWCTRGFFLFVIFILLSLIQKR